MPLVLFSGGMDSCIALFYAIRNSSADNPVRTITFNYGQRHINELHAAERILDLCDIYRGRFILPLPGYLLPNRESSLLAGTKLDVVKKYDETPGHEEAKKDPAFIPHRNLLFLTIAAGYARKYHCGTIYTGLRGGFPDCTEKFLEKVSDVLQTSDPDFLIDVYSPCHGSREETLGLAYSLPGCWDALAFSMTCFEGIEPPCGKCLPCLKRAEGFAKFGKPDPLLERLAKGGHDPHHPKNLP